MLTERVRHRIDARTQILPRPRLRHARFHHFPFGTRGLDRGVVAKRSPHNLPLRHNIVRCRAKRQYQDARDNTRDNCCSAPVDFFFFKIWLVVLLFLIKVSRQPVSIPHKQGGAPRENFFFLVFFGRLANVRQDHCLTGRDALAQRDRRSVSENAPLQNQVGETVLTGRSRIQLTGPRHESRSVRKND